LTPYILMYALLTASIFIKQNRLLLYLLFPFLSIFLTLSYTNGIDWTVYQYSYEFSPYETRGIEFGYTLLVSIFKWMGFNFELFKFVVLTFNLYIILRFIFSETKQPAFVILILFQTFLLGNFFEPALRQLQALVILLLSFDYLFSKKYSKYYCLIILGAFFHQSMLFFLFLPWVIERLNFKITFIIIIIGFFGSPLINNMIFFMTKLPMFSSYSFYLDKNFLVGIPLTPFNIAKVLIYALPFYLLRNYRPDDRRVSIIRSLSYIFFICFVMQFSVMLFYRFNYYFVIFYIIYVSMIFDLFKEQYFRRVTFVFFYISIHFVSLIKGIEYYRDRDSMKYFPYTNYIIEYFNGNVYDSVEDKINNRVSSRLNDSQY